VVPRSGGRTHPAGGPPQRRCRGGYAALERLGIAEDAARLVRELPYGRQRLVEIAVALGLEPKVLLLDEPAAGIPGAESGIIIETIESLSPETGCSTLAFVLVEQHARLARLVALTGLTGRAGNSGRR
jgi:ABC-type branched-subunit amino acid transport system ATPase component